MKFKVGDKVVFVRNLSATPSDPYRTLNTHQERLLREGTQLIIDEIHEIDTWPIMVYTPLESCFKEEELEFSAGYKRPKQPKAIKSWVLK